MKEPSHKAKDSFSKFFHDATDQEKITTFRKVAKKANRDQRTLVRQANLKLRGL